MYTNRKFYNSTVYKLYAIYILFHFLSVNLFKGSNHDHMYMDLLQILR